MAKACGYIIGAETQASGAAQYVGRTNDRNSA
jgi:hypothetical protein